MFTLQPRKQQGYESLADYRTGLRADRGDFLRYVITYIDNLSIICYNVAMKHFITYKKLQPTLKIYRDGQYDVIATYRPVIRAHVRTQLAKIDHWFVHHEWPTDVVA